MLQRVRRSGRSNRSETRQIRRQNAAFGMLYTEGAFDESYVRKETKHVVRANNYGGNVCWPGSLDFVRNGGADQK